MNLQKYKVSLEIAAGIYVILFLTAAYFLEIESEWCMYLKKAHVYTQLQKTFLEKKRESEKNLQTQSTLLAWKNKHPRFFDALQIQQTNDQITHQITASALKAHFNLIQATPIISKSGAEKDVTTHFFELKISGNYHDLFSFISDVIAMDWPITLTQLKANSPHQFDLIFAIEKS